MGIHIPENIVEQTNMSHSELMLEFAVFLYQGEKLTLARAARLAQLSRIQFQKELYSRKIPLNFGVEDLNQEMETIEMTVNANRK